MTKFHANRGVERNKKPLRNMVYEITVSNKIDSDPNKVMTEEQRIEYQKYRFKDEGYMVLMWWYEGNNPIHNWHGYVTEEDVRKRIGDKQWAKFCQGKRLFVVQRRIDGKNVNKKQKS